MFEIVPLFLLQGAMSGFPNIRTEFPLHSTEATQVSGDHFLEASTNWNIDQKEEPRIRSIWVAKREAPSSCMLWCANPLLFVFALFLAPPSKELYNSNSNNNNNCNNKNSEDSYPFGSIHSHMTPYFIFPQTLTM